MGQKFQKEKDTYGYEEDHKDEATLRSALTSSQERRVVGTDATFNVRDLLKFTNSTVNYSPTTPAIKKEDLPVEGAFLVHNLLTPEECQQYIKISEEMGYEFAPLRDLSTTNSDSFSYDKETRSIRNSDRVLFDVPDQIGIVLNQRLLPHLPPVVECKGSKWRVQQMGGGNAKGPINKRWRFNRYLKGQYFRPHFDAGFIYSETEKTLMTFILYLNEGFEGGETTFFPGNQKFAWGKPTPGIEYKIIPKAGTALCFFQEGDLSHRHEGNEVRSDKLCKYILRSDLAYTKILDEHPESKLQENQ